MDTYVQFHTPAALLLQQDPATNTHWLGSWMGSRGGLDTMMKRKSHHCPCQEFNPCYPACSLFIIL